MPVLPGQLLLASLRGRHRRRGRRKPTRQAVAGVVEDGAALAGNDLAEQDVMACQCISHPARLVRPEAGGNPPVAGKEEPPFPRGGPLQARWGGAPPPPSPSAARHP